MDDSTTYVADTPTFGSACKINKRLEVTTRVESPNGFTVQIADTFCVKQELMDDAASFKFAIKEEPGTDFITQTGSQVGFPVQMAGTSYSTNHIKEEWTSDVKEEIQMNDVTAVADSVPLNVTPAVKKQPAADSEVTAQICECLSMKEELVEEQAGPFGDGRFESERLGETSTNEDGTFPCSALKNNKITQENVSRKCPKDITFVTTESYKCFTCRYSSKSKGHLKVHMKKHDVGKRHVCYVTYITSHLKSDKRIHTGYKPFMC